MYEQFQKALDYFLATKTPQEVSEMLIKACEEGWANKKHIDTPYLEMTEPAKRKSTDHY